MRDPEEELEPLTPKTGALALWSFLDQNPGLKEELFAFIDSAYKRRIKFSTAYRKWAEPYPDAPAYTGNLKTSIDEHRATESQP